ncbi:tRNA pseudouridine55 synthase [Fistulifera solaris]|uniref:tRNA pseudouridine(55) synthase n=1 Tax=Fistulifera solaris TaxID=1519565 RepID=A0A1Z5K540_FISSO|nr:tRNA pseudouridine55 synthase [Fistulifera solaris]|eukprot:GAX21360.1 tRNA pseudouridine55 synthase [Fistulifera solaris]
MSTPTTTVWQSSTAAASDDDVPLLYRAEGLFAVHKPLNWTSSNVVSYIRGILERDARTRGAKLPRRRPRIKIGHGGTLDPLATGVLVLGVGKGTKQLESYLSGSKAYRAGAALGFETNTLDMEGNITRRATFDHIQPIDLERVRPHFVGTIEQIPPLFSAIKQNGQRLYQKARKGQTDDDVVIASRLVTIHELQFGNVDLPQFDIQVECGGGTYIRSLIRDIAYQLDTVATTTYLQRTKQGPFTLEDCLEKEDWNADNIYAAIERHQTLQEKTI